MVKSFYVWQTVSKKDEMATMWCAAFWHTDDVTGFRVSASSSPICMKQEWYWTGFKTVWFETLFITWYYEKVELNSWEKKRLCTKAVFHNLLGSNSGLKKIFYVTVKKNWFSECSSNVIDSFPQFNEPYNQRHLIIAAILLQIIFNWKISINYFLLNVSKMFKDPVRRFPSPRTGTRPCGWETLYHMLEPSENVLFLP